MKVKVGILLTIGILILIVYHGSSNIAHGNSFGAPLIGGKGYTGSPFDNRACNVQGCHSGTLNSGPGTPEIIHNIPASGYKSGERYTITAKITQSGKTTFGFQMTAETNTNQKTGSFIAGAQTRAPSDFYITQGTNSAVTTAGSGTKSWTVNWDAPEVAGDGPVTFYTAFNVANGNRSTSGDLIYTTSISVNENIFNGISDLHSESQILVYPNPVNSKLTIKLPEHYRNSKTELEIRELSGRLVKSMKYTEVSHTNELLVDVSEISPGIYYLITFVDAYHTVSKIIIQ